MLAKKLDEASAERPVIFQDDTLYIVGVIADKGSSLLPDFDVMISFIGTFIKVRPDVDREELAEKFSFRKMGLIVVFSFGKVYFCSVNSFEKC